VDFGIYELPLGARAWAIPSAELQLLLHGAITESNCSGLRSFEQQAAGSLLHPYNDNTWARAAWGRGGRTARDGTPPSEGTATGALLASSERSVMEELKALNTRRVQRLEVSMPRKRQ
jgi:hypothetical protein